MTRTGFRPHVIAVLALFLVKSALLASLVVNDPTAFIMGDGFEYQMRADTMARTGQFGITGPDGVVRDDAHRLPGYPAFLTLFRFSDGPERVALWSIVQVVICHAWLLLIGGWMAHRHGETSATYFIVALSATLPWTHYISVVHSDFPFALLLFSGAVHLATALEEGARRHVQASAAAFFLGAAALTRPDLIFLPFWLLLMAGGAVIWNVRFGPSRGHLAVAPILIAGLGTFGSMALWAARNYVVLGRLTYTSFIDTVVMFFSSSAGSAAPVSGGGLLQMTELILANAMKIVLGFGPALAQVFFNPSRWYLHFYMRGWGRELPSSGIPISELGYAGLPPLEYAYMAVEILIPLAVFAVFARFLVLLWKGRIAESAPVLLLGGLAAYLIIQKGIWGALTVGSGQRYGMSILPFIVYFGALTFSRPRPAE